MVLDQPHILFSSHCTTAIKAYSTLLYSIPQRPLVALDYSMLVFKYCPLVLSLLSSDNIPELLFFFMVSLLFSFLVKLAFCLDFSQFGFLFITFGSLKPQTPNRQANSCHL